MTQVAPWVARVAAAAASILDPFGSTPCLEHLTARDELKLALAKAQRQLADWIDEYLAKASPLEQRILLNIRRDCFNQRSLRRHAECAEWQLLPGQLSCQILEIENGLESWQESFASLFQQHRDQEFKQLLSLLETPDLAHGIALASPEVVANVESLRRQSGRLCNRKQKVLADSLLRYVSRAALKTAPFSTLTRLALCSVDLESVSNDFAGSPDCTDSPGDRLQFIGGPWRNHAVAQVRNPLGETRQHLARYEPFRRSVDLQLNNTIVEVDTDLYRLVRPAMWLWNEAKERAEHSAEVLVRYRLTGPLIVWLLDYLPGGPPQTREALVARLSQQLDDDNTAELAAIVERLVELGVLVQLPPWNRSQQSESQNILDHLRKLPPDPALEETAEWLEQVVADERDFPTAGDPVQTIQRIERHLLHCQQGMQQLAMEIALDIDSSPALTRLPEETGLFEDVMLGTDTQADDKKSEILRLSPEVAHQNLQAARPLFRLSAFLGRRWEFLHTLATLGTDLWPGRATVPFLDVFAAALPYWKGYEDATAESLPGLPEIPFNPLRAPAVTELHRLQRQLCQEFSDCLRPEGEHQRLSLSDLELLLEQIPEDYSPGVGPMMFLQPASQDGELWVLNRLFEGTGRYGSRFTQVMTPEDRKRYAAAYIAASVFEHQGEVVELFGVMAGQHSPRHLDPLLTRQVLAVPGTSVRLASSHCLSFVDLEVRFATGRLPSLVDPAGRRLLPIHLGHGDHRSLPSLTRFLSSFGPSDHQFKLPDFSTLPSGRSVSPSPRILVGPLVVRRQRWHASPKPLLTLIDRRSAARAFELTHLWRVAQGLPRKVFVIERRRQGLGRPDKPQYIDFSSPLFVEIFHAIVRSLQSEEQIFFEETLPMPEHFPLGPDGEHWAVELQLEGAVLGESTCPIQTDV